MELNTSTWMMIFFIIFLILSIWKIWAFLPNKQLQDDDTTPDATARLQAIVYKIIQEKEGKLSEQELFESIKNDGEFDSKLFWRFNRNRLRHLLNGCSPEEVYQENIS